MSWGFLSRVDRIVLKKTSTSMWKDKNTSTAPYLNVSRSDHRSSVSTVPLCPGVHFLLEQMLLQVSFFSVNQTKKIRLGSAEVLMGKIPVFSFSSVRAEDEGRKKSSGVQTTEVGFRLRNVHDQGL